MTTLSQILSFLDGRKAIILAIAGLIISYLVTTGVFTGEFGTLLLSILNILGGGAALATNQVLGKRNLQGIRELK